MIRRVEEVTGQANGTQQSTLLIAKLGLTESTSGSTASLGVDVTKRRPEPHDRLLKRCQQAGSPRGSRHAG